MDRIRCGMFSAKTNIPFRAGKLAVDRAARQTLDSHPALCLVFFSERYASSDLVEGIIRSINPEIVAGCSTNGEIASGYWRESVIAIVLSSDYMRFGIAVEDNNNLAKTSNDLTNTSKDYYKQLYESALYDLKVKMTHHSKITVTKNQEIKPDFGIVLLPGTDNELDPKANEVIIGLRKHLGNLPLIGGTVGDDCKYENGYVIYKDDFLENHSLLILCKSDLKFSMAQKHSYNIIDDFILNEAVRNNLVQLNNQPASETYFNAINQPVVEISDLRDEICALNPLGLIDKKTKELQILFPMSRGKGAKEINLSQVVPEGTKIFLTEADIEQSKKTSLESIKAAFSTSTIKDPRIGLMFSCVGRSTFYFGRALAEIEEIKKRFKYTDIGGAYLYGTVCGQSDWVSEGTTSTLIIGNDLKDEIVEKKE